MFGIKRHVLKSSPLALLPLLFLSASTVMLFFCLLAGVTHHNPLNRTFFLQADTSSIPGAPALTHFTMNNACDQRDGINVACRGRHAASPMLPQQFFGTSTGVPTPFLRHPNKYYYLSRFTYAFYIITIFFVVVALLINLAACISTVATLTAAIFTFIALLSMAFTASIMTAVYVQSQNAFRNAGKFARVGVKAFAFTWTSLALIFLSFISLCILWAYRHRRNRQLARTEKGHKNRDSMVGGLLNRRKNRRSYDSSAKRASYDSSYYDPNHREKDIDRGVAHPSAIPGRDPTLDSRGVSRHDYVEPTHDRGVSRHDHMDNQGGTRRFAGPGGEDPSSRPGTRGAPIGRTASPGGRAAPIRITDSPVQLNSALYPDPGQTRSALPRWNQ